MIAVIMTKWVSSSRCPQGRAAGRRPGRVAALRLRPMVDAVVFADEHADGGKPSCAAFEAVLAQLGAKANWHRIMREWVYADPPSTVLGEAEWRYFEGRGTRQTPGLPTRA